MKLEPTVTKSPLYLVRDENGESHWYSRDPLKEANLSSEVKIENVVADLVGSGSRLNPVCVYLSCFNVMRAEPFLPSTFGAMKTSDLPRTVMDLEGCRVSILEEMNDDGHYPFNGVVLDAEGRMIASRTYSLYGECSDGESAHQLVIMFK